MTFERWLQERLNKYGAKLTVDGDIGRATIAALRTFQERQALKVTGVADEATIVALRHDPNTTLVVSVPTATVPPWMYELIRRMGLHEARDKAELVEFLKIGDFLGDPSKLPWCGDAVESAFAKTLPFEALPTNPFFAQNWDHFGHSVDPMVGAVGVIRWSGSAGHVGFISKVTPTQISMVGGNQTNTISNATFPRSAFIGYRWPDTFSETQYPVFKGAVSNASGAISTR